MNTSAKLIALLLLSMATGVTQAACSYDVVVGDYLRYSTPEVSVEKSCTSVTINLRHEGTLAANIMGHNWVLTADADVQAVATEGMSAGIANNYVKPNDARVIAASAVIGGGDKTTLTFTTADLSAGGKYTFFCSFPGHSYGMRGKFSVTP